MLVDGYREPLSITRLSPSNPPPAHRRFFMLKAYFDKSADEREQYFLTLGGIVASGLLWDEFQKQWLAILEEYGIDFFHMAPAMANPPGRPFKGRNTEEMRALAKRLLNLMGQFKGPEFLIKSCTINLLDYERAKRENPKLRTKEAICVNFCCGSGLPLDAERPDAEHQEVELYFDVGEKFKDRIDRVWQRLKKRKNHPGWVDQIFSIGTVSSEDVSGLQAADIVAWTVRGHYCGHEHASAFYLFLTVMGGLHGFYDYERIKTEYANG